MKTDSRTVNSLRNIIVGLLSTIIYTVLPFIIRTVIILKLGAEYAGVSSLFTSILQVISVSELGISSAIIFSLYKPIAEDDYTEINEWLAIYRLVYLIIGIVISIVGISLCPFLRLFISGSYPSDLNIYLLYIIYLANTVISYFFGGYLSVVLIANQRNDIINIIDLCVSVIRSIVQIIILFLTSNLLLYVIVLPIFTFISNRITYRMSMLKYPYCRIRNKPNFGKLKTISKQLKGLALLKITLVAQNSVDSIVLSSILGLSILTIYSNYYLIISSLTSILYVILRGISASIGNCVAIDKKEKLYNDHMKFDFYFMYLNSMITMCLYTLFQPFMKLWVGSALMFPASTMVFFCAYFFFRNVGQIRSLYSEAAGLWWFFRYVIILEVIENLFLDILLGRKWGVNGILIATISTMIINSAIILTHITFKRLFKKTTGYYFANNFLYLIVTMVGCYIFGRIISRIGISSIVHFVVSGLCMIVLSSIYLFVVYVLMPDNRKYIILFISRIKIFGGHVNEKEIKGNN